MNSDKLSLLIKSKIDTNNYDISAEVAKLQEKLPKLKVKIDIDSKQKLHRGISWRSMNCTFQEYLLPEMLELCLR